MRLNAAIFLVMIFACLPCAVFGYTLVVDSDARFELESEKLTPVALDVKVGQSIYYGNLTDIWVNEKTVRINKNGTVYSLYNSDRICEFDEISYTDWDEEYFIFERTWDFYSGAIRNNLYQIVQDDYCYNEYSFGPIGGDRLVFQGLAAQTLPNIPCAEFSGYYSGPMQCWCRVKIYSVNSSWILIGPSSYTSYSAAASRQCSAACISEFISGDIGFRNQFFGLGPNDPLPSCGIIIKPKL